MFKLLAYRNMLYYFFCLLFFANLGDSVKVDVTKTQVWGPGIRENAALPVRYFYIQAYDKNNKVISKDLGDNAFTVKLTSPTTSRVRAYVQCLNRHNGSYIGRFRMYDYSGELSISVTYEGKHVAQSPYKLKEVYGDECYCPIKPNQWKKALQCPKSYKQMESDLGTFPSIDLSTLRNKMVERFAKHHSVCHYAIKDNEIHRECHGSITDFKMFMDAPLLNLAKKVHLPDIEFFINLGDWPLEKTHDNPLPVISWCGSDSSYDIVLPTYDLTNAVLEMLGRITLDILSVQSNTGPSWKNKKELGLFRGRDSRQERLNLAAMSVKNPDIIDAKITNYFFFKQDDKKYGNKTKHISFFDFFQYKYQLNVDGTVAAYRFPYLMAGDALVFKQDSGYYEHFYKQMKPNVHYIPLKHDLSDAIEKIKWAKSNDKEARKISQAGTKLARELLTPAEVLCYHVMLFEKYAAKQVGEVTILDSMEKLEHPKNNACKCKRSKPKKAKKEEL